MLFHKYFFLVIAFGILSSSKFSQSNFTSAFSGKLTIGTYFLNVENQGLERWSSTFNAVIRLDPSVKFFYKNSFSISLGGGATLYSYDFYHGNTNFHIAHFSLHAESNLQKYFYLKDRKLDAFYLGCGIGVISYGNESKRTLKGNFDATTSTQKALPLYFTPQIGTYRKTDRLGMSLALQYCFYSPNTPVIAFEMENALAQATSSHNGSYVGFSLTIDYDLKVKKTSKPIVPKEKLAEPPEDLYSRTLIEAQKLQLKRRIVKVYAWDHGIIDNDTISLVLNGDVVLYNYMLTHTKKKVKLRLNKGDNILIMYAHNEGSIKPNSAAIIVKSRFKKYKFILNSTMESSAVINLEFLE
jgi:hypothetical protein